MRSIEPGDEERRTLERLDALLRHGRVEALLDPLVRRTEAALAAHPGAIMSYETVPLDGYGPGLPAAIASSWIFVIRAGATTGAERHPNSRQRMVSYRGRGDFQVMPGRSWISHHLVSDPDAPLARRWISIPPDTWHQAVVPDESWVVLSFHTAPAEELIEERPDPGDPRSTRRRTYLGPGRGAASERLIDPSS